MGSNPWASCEGCAPARRSAARALVGMRRRHDAVRVGSLLEVLVQRGDDLRALADGAADALHRSRPDVADGEDAGDRRFERTPAGGGAGDDEPGPIELDAAD